VGFAAAGVEAAQVTWRAGLPLVHSTLVPAAMRTLQQGQIVENLATMIMVLVSLGVDGFGARAA
jgi:hypothetical protein